MKNFKHLISSFAVGFLIWGGACGFVALPLEQVANSSRTDASAADGKGGWLDLGSNDLSILPAGEARYAGVPFMVSPSGDETVKNCLILGRSGVQETTLKLTAPFAENCLYLLHAIDGGPAPETHRVVGAISIRYADGSSSEFPLQTGRDLAAWTTGRSFLNATRAWTEYNFNTQVSLFVSQFKLDATKKVAEITFSANGTCPWMIIAASAGAATPLIPVRSFVEPTGSYLSPEPPPSNLGRYPDVKPKNVILIIGDGMGQGAARLASYYKYRREDSVYFQKFPITGLCTTFSANSPVTDSSAAATAFATGVKTSNGVLGYEVDEKHDRAHAIPLTSIATRAHADGRGVAILTSDSLYGATPSAFYAHSLSRGDSARICAQAASCGFDVLIGAARGTLSWMQPTSSGGRRTDGRNLISEMRTQGYTFVQTAAEIDAAPLGAKILGAMTTFGKEKGLGEVLASVLKRLKNHPNGFFLMAECSETDHACHRNDPSSAIMAVSMVEFMAKTAIDFAHARGDTLVIVTADHDTGHPVVLQGADSHGRLILQWSATSHTPFPVPLYAYGPGAELFEGLLDNTDIAKNVARLLSMDECGVDE